jgi:hypothetical protein
MQFTLAAQTLLFNIGDKISFLFQLPNYGEIAVLSEVRYCNIQPNYGAFEAHYGVKFLDFSLENWNSIRTYCDLNQDLSLAQTLEQTKADHRASTAAFLSATIELETGFNLKGAIEDLSFGGARINLDRPLQVNNCVTLNIWDDATALKVKGYCIWCAPEKNAPQLFLAGIYFPRLDRTQFDTLKLFINKAG